MYSLAFRRSPDWPCGWVWAGDKVTSRLPDFFPCYAEIVSIRRITISLQDRLAERAKAAARGVPVSAWVAGLIEEHLEGAALEEAWQRFYRSVSPSRGDRRRAEALMKRLGRPAARGLSGSSV